MKDDNTRAIGGRYEDVAVRFLYEQGFKILERNYRKNMGEIDIVCRDGNELVFVEVKYRKDRKHGGAEFAIPAAKCEKIRKVAGLYLMERHYPMDSFCRFDAILIDGEEITHVKNAW